MPDPKLFLSYSWASEEHQTWVIELASELRGSGVDVILDKWDLKEGHDAHAFMEQMVTDPQVQKVILVCDRTYAEKANKRTGGVGAEAQIITSELYAKKAQDKFVAVVTELDDEGKPFLPAYYRTRIYVDLSDPGKHAQNFDQLLRWIFDKPLHRKPEVGEMPKYLSEEGGTVALATTTRLRRAVEGIRNAREYAFPATTEYLETLANELEKLRLGLGADPYDDAVVESIESFLPYRNEAVDLLLTLARHNRTPETGAVLHRFLEGLIPYLERPEGVTSYSEWDRDNYKFIVHELFLYTVACLLRHEQFQAVNTLLEEDYYLPGNSDYGRDAMVSFQVFRCHMKSLESRNKRLELRRLSLRADLLKERCSGLGIEFRHLMQGDFVCFMRAQTKDLNGLDYWWPETLLYAYRSAGPFEIFARSRSAAYFEQVKVVLGIESKDDLGPLLDGFAAGNPKLPRWEIETFNPVVLLGYKELATKP